MLIQAAVTLAIFVFSVVFTHGTAPSDLERQKNTDEIDKISGGTPAAEGEFPWHVSLQFRFADGTWMHVCDASIVSSEFVLTDQICIFKPESDGRVVAGTLNWSNPGSIHDINETINFEFGLVSLMRVAPPFEFGLQTRPVRLPAPNVESPPATRMTVSGWDESAPFVPSDVLVKLEMAVVDQAKCISSYPQVNVSNFLCALDANSEAGLCSYNAVGAPLVFGEELRGIYYAQYPNCSSPGLFTEVSLFRDWIYQITGV